MKKVIPFAILSIFIFLAACGTDGGSKSVDKNSEGETVTIEHEFGEEEVPKNPENIVVFDFGILDTLDKLDVDVAGVPRVTVPEYLDQYTGDEYVNVGASREPDFEAINEMQPDLIIISDREADLYEEVKQMAPTIYLPVDFTNYMDSFTNNMKTIAKIFDKEDQMENELSQLDEKMSVVREKVADTDDEALIIMANEGKISAYGPGSRYGGNHS
uniref:siderophore ABC transporter substrate-binding protein n=1 Tax=Lentibacillus cibarius TaxID=2583219 RepID=UPI002D777B84|nr:ABC transporter substrate-binding protein [Lentibacillus cibarius]